MYTYFGASLAAQTVKNLPVMQEREIWSLNREDPLEKGTATHCSTLAWRIPPTEEPSELQSMGSQSRTRLSDYHTLYMFLHSFPLRFITGCWLHLPGLHRGPAACPSCITIRICRSQAPAPSSPSTLPRAATRLLRFCESVKTVKYWEIRHTGYWLRTTPIAQNGQEERLLLIIWVTVSNRKQWNNISAYYIFNCSFQNGNEASVIF